MSITLTPLSTFPLPPTYLLTVDTAQILLDCGAFDKSSESTLPASLSPASSSSLAATDAATPTTEQVTAYLAKLRDLAPSLNLVLLSHPLLTSLGLLPWLKARCGLRCPVYATLPTREMGRYAVEEWAEARSAAEKNEAREVVVAAAAAGAAAKDKDGKKSTKGKGKEKQLELLPNEEDDVEMKQEGEETKEGEENAESKEDEASKDPWDQAWKLTIQEIRDAFLAINAVRWTQPIHLSGSFPFLSLLPLAPSSSRPSSHQTQVP